MAATVTGTTSYTTSGVTTSKVSKKALMTLLVPRGADVPDFAIEHILLSWLA